MRKKICILQNGLYWGGTDTFVINLCKGLDKDKYDITVVNPISDPSQREQELLAVGAKILHTTPLHGIKGRLKHFWQLYKILRKERFDVFQTNIDLFNGPNLMVAWLARVPKRLCHSHNSLHQKALKGETIPVKLYQSVMRWMCWNFSNRRSGCSELANDFLYKGRDWRNSSYPTIVNNGIDLIKYQSPINRDEYKKQLGLTAKYHIITIGHLNDQKNPLFTAKLLADFLPSREDCDMIWVGDGPLKSEVIKILEEGKVSDRVHFFSKRKDIKELLKCSDVFILPSNFEGLGIVAIEAQASNIPTILSNEIPPLANAGGAVFLPIDNGVKEWSKLINSILSGETILKSDSKLLFDFSIDKMTNQMSEIFES